MLDEAPIWDRDGDWLAARAAVAKRLEARSHCHALAPVALAEIVHIKPCLRQAVASSWDSCDVT